MEAMQTETVGINDLSAPLFVAWQLTSACNLDCLHCCEEAGHEFPDEMNEDEIMNFCRQIAEADVPYVAISGGEPLLHPGFFRVCEFLSSKGIKLKVETNGLFIDEHIAERFSDMGFRSVQISIDGATSGTHEKMRPGGNWAKATAATRLLVKKNVNTEIVFVPTKFNYKEVGDLIDLAASIGVYGVYTGKIMRIGRAAQNWDALNPTEEEYKEFFRILEQKVNKYDGKMKIFFYPYDVVEELKYRTTSPAASLLVIPNGKVKLIGPLPFVCADVKKHSFLEAWENYKQAWKNPRVLEYVDRVVADHSLLAQSNKWVELY